MSLATGVLAGRAGIPLKGDPVRIGTVDSLVLATACASALEPAVAVVVDQLAVPVLALCAAHAVF